MAKPEKAAHENHGQAVSQFVHELQAAREPGASPGLGAQVSEFAHEKGGEDTTPAVVDFEDGVITVVHADGVVVGAYETFADALEAAADGDTLQVGAGTYEEEFELTKDVTIAGEEGAIYDDPTLPDEPITLVGGTTDPADPPIV